MSPNKLAAAAIIFILAVVCGLILQIFRSQP